MKVIIVEDEQLAQERLALLIKQYDAAIEIVTCLESVEETLQWLSTKPLPDLFFMDIHLADGNCFDILQQHTLTTPIIFTTAYDQYAMDAFQHFSIDYILKPVTQEALAKALQKYQLIKSAIVPTTYQNLVQQVSENIGTTYKNRFLAKVGQRLFFIPTSDITYFAADNKIVYLFDKDQNRFMVNNTIEKLEKQLQPKEFFKINRKVIVKADAIEQVKPYFNNRLQVHLKGLATNEDLVISRERVAEFREWAEG